jgi:hypothetical protein
MSLASFALSLLASGEHALWLMLVRLAGCQKATRCEGTGEIIFCCPAHLKHLFAEGRDLLFRFSRAQIFVSANFRER